MDTPNKSELIAANQSIAEIERFVEADSLSYLPIERLKDAVADTDKRFCYACYTGKYPTPLIQIEELAMATKSRC